MPALLSLMTKGVLQYLDKWLLCVSAREQAIQHMYNPHAQLGSVVRTEIRCQFSERQHVCPGDWHLQPEVVQQIGEILAGHNCL